MESNHGILHYVALAATTALSINLRKKDLKLEKAVEERKVQQQNQKSEAEKKAEENLHVIIRDARDFRPC